MGFRIRSEQGDTIVEVLIAVAVVSSVLAISYSIMNRNLQIMRDNQERTEASKIAQAQLERLKNAKNNNITLPTGQTAPIFCMDSGVVEGFANNAGHTNIGSDNLEQYPNQCKSSFYRTSIRYNNNEGSYTVRVRWDGLTGTRNEVLMGYKLQ